MQKNVVVSTCGTALLMNRAVTPDERRRLNSCSNLKHETELSPEDRDYLTTLISNARNELAGATLTEVQRMSAELNGVIRFYNNVLPRSSADLHILLCTDTWLSEQVAKLEEDWLRKFFQSVEVRRQTDLQTAEVQAFQLALSELVKWSEEVFPGYHNNHYRIIFNLTGGFKSVQGFLQTLAMFYADEVVYVFQEANSLMRIPRLPVELNAIDTVRTHIDVFRRLAKSLRVNNITGVPETLLMSVGGEITLSPWGSLVWEKTRKHLYREKLWPSPSEKLKYSTTFNASVRSLQPDRLCMVNEKIDDLARFLETGINPRSLDFKELKGSPRPPSTHEMDAWSDQDAKRLYGHYEDGPFVLDEFAKALH